MTPLTRIRKFFAHLDSFGDQVDSAAIRRGVATDLARENRQHNIRLLAHRDRDFIASELRRYGVTNMGIASRLHVGRPLTHAQQYSLMNDPIPEQFVTGMLEEIEKETP